MNGLESDKKPQKFLSTEKSEFAFNNARARIRYYDWDTWDDYIEYVSKNIYTVRHRDKNNEGHLEIIDKTNYDVEINKKIVDNYRTWRRNQGLKEITLTDGKDIVTFDDYLDNIF